MVDIDYFFINYITYNHLIFVVFVTILVIILLLLLIKYEKFAKYHNLLKLLVFILITIKADNQWCYLLCIFILAFHWNFITENIFEIIERLLFAYHGVNYGNCSEQDKKEKNEVDFEEINKEKKIKFEKENCNNKQENWKKYLRTGLIKSLQVETKCLDALEKQYNLNFERNKKLYKDSYIICPDGIIREKHKDILAEIKYINEYNPNTIKNIVFEKLYKYINFYKINLPIKKVDFYFVLYIDSKLSDSEKQVIRKSFEVQFCNDRLYNYVLEIFDNNKFKISDN